ncbi:uncharacterized protein [Coffea arabica]|uniref:Uncharacterized protein n=1 Tax=Coffea arabica TaxID=13443 RepID=A0A6P6V3U8_COFAR|nr:uncharacterized protein LOC113717077 [Coffea arabica]
MRVLVWNCQEVGNPLIVLHLREVNNLFSPNLIFLSETKNKKLVINRIARGLRFNNNVVVEAMNRAGGMALFWTKETQILEVNTTAFTIEAKIEDIGSQGLKDNLGRGVIIGIMKERSDKDWTDVYAVSNGSKNLRRLHIRRKKNFWSQKARISWLRKGDKNTKYFHTYVKRRRVSNRIRNLQRENSSWTENEDEVVTEISDFFKELFKSGGMNDMSEILDGIPHSITQEMNDKLTKAVEEDEIHDALFSMNPEKAPGQDGMSPLFFQRFWRTIKSDIIPAIKAFFNSEFMLKSINHTVISLIPKILHPTSLKNYKPIILCSVLYKIISKILRVEVGQALGVMVEAKQGKYLKLPMVISRTKDQIFGFVRENIKRRLQNWKNKFLSSVGKEVMLKAVAMAMPTYVMSCFKLPRKFCKDIRALMANFWWRETNGRNKMHWISWERMALHENARELGIKDLEAFNKALLGKQVWRLLTKLNLHVSKVLKVKYFPKESIL